MPTATAVALAAAAALTVAAALDSVAHRLPAADRLPLSPATGAVTATLTVTATATLTATGTVTSTAYATLTSTATATSTVTATVTSRATATATGVVSPTAGATPVVSATATSTATATGTATESPPASATTTPIVTTPATTTGTAAAVSTATSTEVTATGTSPPAAPARRPAYVPHASRHGWLAARDAVMGRVIRRTMAMTGTMTAWNWESGIALVGLMHAHRATRDPAVLDFVQAWVDARLAEGTPFSGRRYGDPDCAGGGWPDESSLRHPNHAAAAWAVLLLHQERPHPAYRQQVELAVDFLAHRACRTAGALAHLPDQLWDDTLAMSAPLMARAAGLLERPELLDDAADQILRHADRLQDRDGVWFHGWNARTGDHMSGGHWARGNGWAALATAEVLGALPPDHPDAPALRAVLSGQLQGLAAVQHADGLWHTIVHRPDFYLETSGSAAIAAALLSAPLADGDATAALRRAGRRARAAAYVKVAEDGAVTGVSAGTGVAPSLAVYNQVPTDASRPYGQGLWLIMAAAGR